MWISPKLFLDRLNAWINRKFASREIRNSALSRNNGVPRGDAFHRPKWVGNKGNGLLLKGCPDWELDSTISLEMTDLLDDISVYEEELKCADSDPSHEISISVLEPR